MAITLPVNMNPLLLGKRPFQQASLAVQQATLGGCWVGAIAIAAASAVRFATHDVEVRHFANALLLGALLSFVLAVAGAVFVGLMGMLIGPALTKVPALSKRVVTVDDLGVHRKGVSLIRRDEVSLAFKRGKRDIVVLYNGFEGDSTVLQTDSEAEADALLHNLGFETPERPVGTLLVATTNRRWLDVMIRIAAVLAFQLEPDVDLLVGRQVPTWCAFLLVLGAPMLVLILGKSVEKKWNQLTFGLDGLRAPDGFSSRFIPYADIAHAKFDASRLVLSLETDKKPFRVTLQREPNDPATTDEAILKIVEEGCAGAKQKAIAARPIAASLEAGSTEAAFYRVAATPTERWLDVVADGASDVRVRVQAADAVLNTGDESLRDQLRDIAEGSACAELQRYGRRAA